MNAHSAFYTVTFKLKFLQFWQPWPFSFQNTFCQY
uniref:Uncharacterized protein n=1 Tax=Anguilla anguilla TaxID=7936 RepID=A0A0E9TGE3_ANGAN